MNVLTLMYWVMVPIMYMKGAIITGCKVFITICDGQKDTLPVRIYHSVYWLLLLLAITYYFASGEATRARFALP